MSKLAAAEPNQDRLAEVLLDFAFCWLEKVLSYVDTLENLQEEGVGDWLLTPQAKGLREGVQER
jgi:hypothetical protein